MKTPKLRNCTSYLPEFAAEAKEHWSCLRCRPEVAPGNTCTQAGCHIARAAARLIEDGRIGAEGLDGISARFHVSTRHLRRVFQDEFGVSPIAFLQTCRLFQAKRLLTSTALPITEVAFTAGFSSVRQFHALFRECYGMSPRHIRRTSAVAPGDDMLRFTLGYRQPYDWVSLSRFLTARTISGVETFQEGAYCRMVRISQGGEELTGWIRVRPAESKAEMQVTVSASLTKAVPLVLSRVRHLLDLSCNPACVAAAPDSPAALKPGLRVPGAFDGFEVAVRAILGQQVSVAAARTLAGRFAAAFGIPVQSPWRELTTTFPCAARVANLRPADVAALGVLRSRSQTIVDLARAVTTGTLELIPGANVAGTLEILRSVRGIGEWTAQYIAMRALAWPDAFPHTDLGVMKAMRERNPTRILALAEAWRPWRSYAVMHLWSAEMPDQGPLGAAPAGDDRPEGSA